jgi:16S rRNA (uracil1498-N3)-methyltransferase
MEIRRFFVDKKDIVDGKITLTGDEFYHMTKVLRYKVGYKAVILANDGIERHSVVEEIGKDSAILAVENEVVADRKNATITLYAGLLKNNKLDFVVQKGVELGVDNIVPFISQNSAETKFNSERANKIALESAKQCGSVYLSKVGDLVDYDKVIDDFKCYDKVIFAYENEKTNRIVDAVKGAKNLAIVVGPEGGFTPEETERAIENGATVVTLGRRILRAETASIVSATLALESLGELDYD